MVTPRRKADKTPPARKSTLKGARVVIVEARYYDDIADTLLEGATDVLKAAGVAFDVVSVPGALEIPTAVAIAFDAGKAKRKTWDGAVALGCVIRGETSHYDIVANESAHALMAFSVAQRFPIGNGILTVDTDAQAWARAKRDGQNKGGVAAEAALALIRLKGAKAKR